MKLQYDKTKMNYHKILERKIVLDKNVIFSLKTEFIENEKEDVSKKKAMVFFSFLFYTVS
ncbi:hypothetical protein LG34_15145 [Eubacterium ramulus]|uniref:Uncharacterized protein n=1 Tax=Eubacterium ramulus TaxID=39490 RepID=A0A2V1JQH4_EUBRA|nr:hypothetical protein LG34_15145 [Eubacterium ramulus]RHV66148.1 hypothetical protein DXB15_13270 [Roseburia sp. OM02-15]